MGKARQGIFAGMLVLVGIFCFSLRVGAQSAVLPLAQPVKAIVAVCDERATAEQLMATFKDGGRKGVEAFVANTRNRCPRGEYFFTAGRVVGTIQFEGQEWSLLEVAPLFAPREVKYAVGPYSVGDVPDEEEDEEER